MFGSLKKKSLLSPDIYDKIMDDVRIWCVNELANLPPRLIDGVQHNALLNFATFDLHSLMTTNGYAQMHHLLAAEGTDQTVMLRIKGLVEDLYIKYGEEIIDELRARVYKTLKDLYGITFDIENTLDINNTFWLQPFVRRMYTELKFQAQS